MCTDIITTSSQGHAHTHTHIHTMRTAKTRTEQEKKSGERKLLRGYRTRDVLRSVDRRWQCAALGSGYGVVQVIPGALTCIPQSVLPCQRTTTVSAEELGFCQPKAMQLVSGAPTQPRTHTHTHTEMTHSDQTPAQAEAGQALVGRRMSSGR